MNYVISKIFYSHVNYSVTKIVVNLFKSKTTFYSHVNYSVTKIKGMNKVQNTFFYSHVNYSVTKIALSAATCSISFTVT